LDIDHSTHTPHQKRWLIAIFSCAYWGLIYLTFGSLIVYILVLLSTGQVQYMLLAVLLGFLAAAILWVGFPVPLAFSQPGIPLAPDQQPMLFQSMRQAAREVQAGTPHRILLTVESDLYLVEVTWLPPFGGERWLVIGLPLLQVLPHQQLQALAAAELAAANSAAFSNAPDRFSGWVYRHWRWIRAISRRRKKYWLRLVFFRWYARHFLKLTSSLVQDQDRTSDRRAAQWAGANVFSAALRARVGTSAAFQAFLEHELAPVVDAGFKPPIIEGFSGFLSSEMVQGAIQQVILRDSSRTERSVDDLIAPLGWRLQGIADIDDKRADEDTTPAITLLNNLPGLENRLLNHLFKPGEVARWKPIEWEKTGVEVFLPLWQRTLKNYAGALKGIHPEDLDVFLYEPDALWVAVKRSSPVPLSKQEVREGILRVCAIALTIALVRCEWQVDVPLGQAISLSRGGETVRPFELLTNLAAGKMDPFSWQRFIRQAGIAGIDLGGVI
jgi:hypothetical protein